MSSIAVLFCISVLAQNSASLRLNLEKNKVYRFKSTSDQTIIQTVNGNQQTIETKVNYVVSLKMIDATADLLVTEVRFDTLITKTNAMGKVVNFTSASEGNISSTESADVMSCIMNRLSKNAIYVKLDHSGNITDVINAKMLGDVIMKDTSSITGMAASALKLQIKNMFTVQALKTMIEPFTHYLPGKQVNTGDTWTIDMSSSSGGMSLDISTSYHLDGIKDNTASVTAESAIKAAANAAPMSSGGAKITYDDIKGINKSNMVIDINTGLLIEEKAKSHISGNLGVSMPGMSMQIPMDISGETKVVAVK